MGTPRVRAALLCSLAAADAAGPAADLASFIAAGRSDELPDSTVEQAKMHILDTVASIVASAHLKPARVARAYVTAQGGGPGPVTLLTTNASAPLSDGIFANAMAGHAAEINDFSPSAFVQPGPAVVAAALGVAEARGAAGAAVLRAVVSGYEVGCRFPKAMGTGNLRAGGLEAHGVGAAFGAAAAAASVLGLPQRETQYALSLTAQQASGSINWLRDVEHVEKSFLFAGMPARQGASAALMADAGFTGVAEPFDGEPNFLTRSWLRAPPLGDKNVSVLTAGLGVQWELPTVGFKKYPVGGPTEPAVDAMLALVKRGIGAADARAVAVELSGSPAPFMAAQMPALNLPYLMALVLEDGELDFDMAQSRDRMATPTIQALMQKVKADSDPTLQPATGPRVEAARVTITLPNGTSAAQLVPSVQGYPSSPFTSADIDAKALRLMQPRVGATAAQRLIDLVHRLDTLPSVAGIIDAMRIHPQPRQ